MTSASTSPQPSPDPESRKDLNTAITFDSFQQVADFATSMKLTNVLLLADTVHVDELHTTPFAREHEGSFYLTTEGAELIFELLNPGTQETEGELLSRASLTQLADGDQTPAQLFDHLLAGGQLTDQQREAARRHLDDLFDRAAAGTALGQLASHLSSEQAKIVQQARDEIRERMLRESQN